MRIRSDLADVGRVYVYSAPMAVLTTRIPARHQLSQLSHQPGREVDPVPGIWRGEAHIFPHCQATAVPEGVRADPANAIGCVHGQARRTLAQRRTANLAAQAAGASRTLAWARPGRSAFRCRQEAGRRRAAGRPRVREHSARRPRSAREEPVRARARRQAGGCHAANARRVLHRGRAAGDYGAARCDSRTRPG